MDQHVNQEAPVPSFANRPETERTFIGDYGFANGVHDGQSGFKLNVRLTSYRALPLSCIAGIELKIDGEPIDTDSIIFTLNHYSHKVAELPGLSQDWWFILDFAELFVPRYQPLAPGYHDVEGTLVTVEPYITAGRFSFFNTSSKRLLLEEEV